MKTRKQFLSLGLSALLLANSLHAQAMRKDPTGFTASVVSFNAAPSTPQRNQVVVKHRNVVVVKPQTRTQHVTRRQYIYIQPKRGVLDFEPGKITFENQPVIINDIAYAPLRELVTALERFGIRVTLDHRVVAGKHRFSLDVKPISQANTSSECFKQGLYLMWKGRIADSIAAFRRAEKLGGEDAEDAKGMAEWLSEGAPKGAVVFHWWDLPKGVRILIDDEEVDHGVPMMLLAEGEHKFQIIGKNDYTLFDGNVRIRSDKALTLAFDGRER